MLLMFHSLLSSSLKDTPVCVTYGSHHDLYWLQHSNHHIEYLIPGHIQPLLPSHLEPVFSSVEGTIRRVVYLIK